MRRPHSVAVMMSFGLIGRRVMIRRPWGHWSGVVVRIARRRRAARSIVALRYSRRRLRFACSASGRGELSLSTMCAARGASFRSNGFRSLWESLRRVIISGVESYAQYGVWLCQCQAGQASHRGRPLGDSYRASSGRRGVLFYEKSCIVRFRCVRVLLKTRFRARAR